MSLFVQTLFMPIMPIMPIYGARLALRAAFATDYLDFTFCRQTTAPTSIIPVGRGLPCHVEFAKRAVRWPAGQRRASNRPRAPTVCGTRLAA